MWAASAAALLAAVIAGAVWLTSRASRGGEAVHGKRRSPPGPRPLPIIGNLHAVMGPLPHMKLYELAKKHGPIMSLRLGSVPAVVVSSPEAAELFLRTHDLAFASRPFSRIAQEAFYGAKGVALCPYGAYWRNARKLVAVKLLNAAKTDAVAALRMQELRRAVRSIRRSAEAREAVDVSGALGEAFESTTYQMVFGQGKHEAFGMKKHAEEMLYVTGVFDVADFIPFLRPFDPMRLGRLLREASRSFDAVLERMIEESLREGSTAPDGDDVTRGFLGILLSMLGEPFGSHADDLRVDRDTVKGLLLDMLVAALDTSFTGADWGMSELIRHPRVMHNLQDELARVVGPNRMVEVSDLPDLPYLDMVVKETLRLHPPGPLLVPHESTEDATVDGYFIPKNTRLFIHAWAIARDPGAWPERTHEFYPERFRHGDVDIQGRDYQLLPFGSGRRVCPGWKMGMSAVKMALAQLAHCFDWELPGGAPPEELDMTEKFGLAVSRANHLLAFPRYRLHC